MAPGVAIHHEQQLPLPQSGCNGSAVATGMPASTPSAGQWEFLQTWTNVLQPRLARLLAILGSQEVAKNLVLAQIWTYLPVITENKQLLKAEEVCLIGTADLQQFHSLCCHEGVMLNQLGPMGKVWESGVVQVVQNAENLSTDSHPCNRLAPGFASCIGEVIYVPVYDASRGSNAKGVVAVFELMMSARSHDVMVVANMISTISLIMETLQLSLSSETANNNHTTTGISASPTPVEAPNASTLQQHNRQQSGGPASSSVPVAAAIPEKGTLDMNGGYLERHSAPPGIDAYNAGLLVSPRDHASYAETFQRPSSFGSGGLSRTVSLHSFAHN